MIAVIEPETGDYFLAKTLTEALRKAKAEYPGKIFYSIRIGYPFAHELSRTAGPRDMTAILGGAHFAVLEDPGSSSEGGTWPPGGARR